MSGFQAHKPCLMAQRTPRPWGHALWAGEVARHPQGERIIVSRSVKTAEPGEPRAAAADKRGITAESGGVSSASAPVGGEKGLETTISARRPKRPGSERRDRLCWRASRLVASYMKSRVRPSGQRPVCCDERIDEP